MDYPNLDNAPMISFDIETYDPDLQDMGPGVYSGKGYILGVGIGAPGGFQEYYNLGHYDCTKQERERNIAYLRQVLGNSVPKIGQAIMYDLDWLENGPDKIKVNGKLISIDIAEALLDETRMEYNMEALGQKYLGEGKTTDEIQAICDANGWKGDPRRWLWKMPYYKVRNYGRGDVDLPIRIYEKQLPILEEQELIDLLELECRLIRCLLFMRKTGVLIDQEKRDRNGLKVQNMLEEMEHNLFSQYGRFNYNSSQQVAAILDKEGIPYPYTESKMARDGHMTKGGNPSINAYFFKRYSEEYGVVKQIAEVKKARNMLDTFIMGSHAKFVCPDGLIHPQFFNMRNDMLGALKGTRSGRLSGANPNLQQQPAKSTDEFWGQICREDFVPFPGCLWGKLDYSQIEYRFMGHFAIGDGADDLRAAYINNPKTDYHQFIVDLTGLTRKQAKSINFGVAYGMGSEHMAELFGWDVEHARDIIAIYHARAPYIKTTMKKVEEVARRRGYIKTFLKRRSHLTDPKKAYTMYCRLVQGSAADLMKSSLVQAYEQGYFDELAPHITVHDEIDVSVPANKHGIDTFKDLQHLMNTSLKIKVPIIADAEIGPNWADVEEFEWDDLYRRVC